MSSYGIAEEGQSHLGFFLRQRNAEGTEIETPRRKDAKKSRFSWRLCVLAFKRLLGIVSDLARNNLRKISNAIVLIAEEGRRLTASRI